MKFWLILITTVTALGCKSTKVENSGAVTVSSTDVSGKVVSSKEQKKTNFDSLFLDYSLPIAVAQSENFKQLNIGDSLIAMLFRKKYTILKKEDAEKLVKDKMSEALPLDPQNLQATMKVMKDKETMARSLESGNPYLQQIVFSFLKKDAELNYINVKRYNLPKSRKSREWLFTYKDAEPANLIASRILDSLIQTKSL
jgi:hypothetical protein